MVENYKYKKLGLKFREESWNRIQAISDKYGIFPSDFINFIVHDYLINFEKDKLTFVSKGGNKDDKKEGKQEQEETQTSWSKDRAGCHWKAYDGTR